MWITPCGWECMEVSVWCKKNPGLITFTGMNHSAFNKCLELFAPYFDSYSLFFSNGWFSIKHSPHGHKLKFTLKTVWDWFQPGQELEEGGLHCTWFLVWQQLTLDCM